MHTESEKKNFAKRLQAACANSKPPITTASELARHFSLRYKNGSISPGAVRKWWKGEAIPTEDKIEVLAQWLKVPKNWLRSGEVKLSANGESSTEAKTAEEILLLGRWRSLTPTKRKILMALLAEFEK